MGTPEFAVESLDILVRNNYNIVGVITVPDKPAGRGQQLQQSAVKEYALKKGLTVLQPEKLKDESFLRELKALNADLQVVVAFRMLPEVVWNMPPVGTINLHGSLLPQYRGAAPINWTIINGEKETGVSTFFLQHEIDTGKIIFREKISIGEDDTAGEVHDKLMIVGASLILKTVQAIEKKDYPQLDQSQFVVQNELLKSAPKIMKEDCLIDWHTGIDHIHNFVRGLSPYPATFTNLNSPDNKTIFLKVFKTEKEFKMHSNAIGSIHTDSKKYMKVAVSDGFIHITDLQLAGKKRMKIDDFLRGCPITEEWRVS